MRKFLMLNQLCILHIPIKKKQSLTAAVGRNFKELHYHHNRNTHRHLLIERHTHTHTLILIHWCRK